MPYAVYGVFCIGCWEARNLEDEKGDLIGL
jgi:hypothetical protein